MVLAPADLRHEEARAAYEAQQAREREEELREALPAAERYVDGILQKKAHLDRILVRLGNWYAYNDNHHYKHNQYAAVRDHIVAKYRAAGWHIYEGSDRYSNHALLFSPKPVTWWQRFASGDFYQD